MVNTIKAGSVDGVVRLIPAEYAVSREGTRSRRRQRRAHASVSVLVGVENYSLTGWLRRTMIKGDIMCS